LFGHTVQWNVNPDAYELGQPRQPPVKEDALPALMEYESEAARYALRMLHDVGIADAEADQWLSDYSACDVAYLHHYYRTGEKRDFLSFWWRGTPIIETQPIPAFTLIKRSLRSDGVVI
jgi:hypothetical protein